MNNDCYEAEKHQLLIRMSIKNFKFFQYLLKYIYAYKNRYLYLPWMTEGPTEMKGAQNGRHT